MLTAVQLLTTFAFESLESLFKKIHVSSPLFKFECLFKKFDFKFRFQKHYTFLDYVSSRKRESEFMNLSLQNHLVKSLLCIACSLLSTQKQLQVNSKVYLST